MKIVFNIILTSALLLMLKTADAQPLKTSHHDLSITYNKTSSLVFAMNIKYVDRGSRDILAQKAQGASNVLHLKAGKKDFPETNLTVITSDGSIHEFTINYAEHPNQLINQVEPNFNKDNPTVIFLSAMNDTDFERYATEIIKRKKTFRLIKQHKHKIDLALQGIYIKEDIIFYHLQIKNRSNINYNTDFIRFYIEDKIKAKRTASQEFTRIPLYVYGNDKKLTAQSTSDIVYALEKFTIPDSKLLHIEIFEHNGGRNLTLAIKNKAIVNAAKLQ